MKLRGLLAKQRIRDPQRGRRSEQMLRGRRLDHRTPDQPEREGDRRDRQHDRGGFAEGRRDHHHDKHHERGWRGRDKPKVGRGDVRAALLLLLSEGPQHGYQLIQQITTRSSGVWRPSAGSVYPALQLLEDQQLIQGQQAEERRVYRLTEAGSAYIEQHRDELAAAWAGVTATATDPVRELRELFGQLGDAVRQVGQVGTATQIAAVREVLTQARRQVYRVLADDPPDEGG